MISMVFARLGLACACSASWPYRWAPAFYRAAAITQRIERRLLQAPAWLLAWTFGILGVVIAAIGCVLVCVAGELIMLCERDEKVKSLEDLEA